jgi:hypothetical protein
LLDCISNECAPRDIAANAFQVKRCAFVVEYALLIVLAYVIVWYKSGFGKATAATAAKATGAAISAKEAIPAKPKRLRGRNIVYFPP